MGGPCMLAYVYRGRAPLTRMTIRMLWVMIHAMDQYML